MSKLKVSLVARGGLLMPLKVNTRVLYRSLKAKVYNVGVRGREFTETKYVFLRLNGHRWANGD